MRIFSLPCFSSAFVLGTTFVPPGCRRDHRGKQDTEGVLLVHLASFVTPGADGKSQAVSPPAPAPWTCPAMDASGK